MSKKLTEIENIRKLLNADMDLGRTRWTLPLSPLLFLKKAPSKKLKPAENKSRKIVSIWNYLVSYICTTLGMMFTLPSSTLKLFSSENTTLNRIMTETELSLLGSVSFASTLIVTPFCGYFLDSLGRKRTITLFYLPQLLGWALIVTVFRVEAFICAMFLCGLSGSIFLIVPIYVGEYCDPCIRGAMASSGMIFHGVGMAISYLVGGLLDYNTVNYIGLTLTVIGFVLLSFLKESPLHLMKKGFEEEAAKSIAFYKGVKLNSKGVLTELENIRRLLKSDLGYVGTPEEERLKKDETKLVKKLPIWKYLTKSRSTRRVLLILLIIFTLSLFQGLIVIEIFAEPLFEAAVSSMSSTLSSVLFAIIKVGAGLIAACLIDKAGRRMLLIVASIATSLFSVILGTQIQLIWGPSWLNAVLIYLYSIAFTVGAGTVPLVLLGEVFLPEIKSFASMVCVEWAAICSFVILYIFNPLVKAYGLGIVFYLFAGFSCLTTLFSFIYLPETKGISADIIQQKFLERNFFKP